MKKGLKITGIGIAAMFVLIVGLMFHASQDSVTWQEYIREQKSMTPQERQEEFAKQQREELRIEKERRLQDLQAVHDKEIQRLQELGGDQKKIREEEEFHKFLRSIVIEDYPSLQPQPQKTR